jgi:hypothetical protein
MELLCHRCGNPLHEGETFCARCGAPQFLVEATDGITPQAPPVRFAGDTRNVEWRAAITSALLVAVPVGLLSALTTMSSLFVIGGGFAAIALYRRRSSAVPDGRTGWRVGMILGAASAAVASAADAARLLVERYFLHHGPTIDAGFSTVAQQLSDEILKNNPEAVQQAPQLFHSWANFWLSADGHAAIRLLTAAVVSLGMILFAGAGGAIAGRILAMRTRVPRSL